MPDVPKIQIESPEIYHTYLFGRELPTIFKKLPIQQAAPRIIGKITVKIRATNTNKVEFYLDNELVYVDEEPPFNWELNAPFGLHTLETFAYNENNISKDVRDIFILL
jgi:hypothetical protein